MPVTGSPSATPEANGNSLPRAVLIVDPHRLVSTALCTALRRAGLDAHERPVSDHHSIVATAARYPGGVVLLELALGRDAGGRLLRVAELIAALRVQGNPTVVLSAHANRADDARTAPGIAAAVAAGAIGAISKSATFESLRQTLVRAVAGLGVLSAEDHARWLCRHRHQQRRAQERGRRWGRLTTREREVLELMATGHRAAAIADHFVVALPTVRAQIRSVLVKLEVTSQLEAVALLFDAGCDAPVMPAVGRPGDRGRDVVPR